MNILDLILFRLYVPNIDDDDEKNHSENISGKRTAYVTLPMGFPKLSN